MTQGRLMARPGRTSGAASRGLQKLGLAAKRDGLLYVPAGYRPERPAPFVLMLHGAGSDARRGLKPLRPFADAAGLVLLAVESRARTWDLILGGYGPDVAFIDRALRRAFGRLAVNPAHVAIAGFSHGATYALSLGTANGDLFTHAIAFSPGPLAPAAHRGAPRLFLSHGLKDSVLPINSCSRRIVPLLKRAGYAVRYREFSGGHTVPREIAREAVAWFTGPA